MQQVPKEKMLAFKYFTNTRDKAHDLLRELWQRKNLCEEQREAIIKLRDDIFYSSNDKYDDFIPEGQADSYDAWWYEIEFSIPSKYCALFSAEDSDNVIERVKSAIERLKSAWERVKPNYPNTILVILLEHEYYSFGEDYKTILAALNGRMISVMSGAEDMLNITRYSGKSITVLHKED
jgi:hypothetical protein